MVLKLDGIATGGDYVIQFEPDLEILGLGGLVVQGSVVTSAVPWEETVSSGGHELGTGLLFAFQIVADLYNGGTGRIINGEIDVVGILALSRCVGCPVGVGSLVKVLIAVACTAVTGNVCIGIGEAEEQIIRLWTGLQRPNVNIVNRDRSIFAGGGVNSIDKGSDAGDQICLCIEGRVAHGVQEGEISLIDHLGQVKGSGSISAFTRLQTVIAKEQIERNGFTVGVGGNSIIDPQTNLTVVIVTGVEFQGVFCNGVVLVGLDVVVLSSVLGKDGKVDGTVGNAGSGGAATLVPPVGSQVKVYTAVGTVCIAELICAGIVEAEIDMILLREPSAGADIDVVEGNLGLLAVGVLDLVNKGADRSNISCPVGIHGDGVGHIALAGYIGGLEGHTDRTVADIISVYTVEENEFTVAVGFGRNGIVQLKADLADFIGTGGVF